VLPAGDVISYVRALLPGQPVFLAGSLVAEHTYGLTDAHSDVDLFCPTGNVLVAVGQRLLCEGFTLDDRFERVWQRWLKYGFKTWHTNSLKLLSPIGEDFNLVYKLTEGHAATSLASVLESFDFGLLGTGYDLESNQYRDMRPYLFPFTNDFSQLPLMPNKRANWRAGFISQYNGLRECGRYAKYAGYGYDLTKVKDDLVTGYMEASAYMSTRFKPEQQQLGKIYEAIAGHIDNDHIDELIAAYKTLDFQDSLDVIMEALE
jgi:hypothetical protein